MPKLNPQHHISLREGRFDRTTPVDLDSLFGSARGQGAKTLVVFVHGGLVNQAAGRLLGPYGQPGSYPAFFLWRSGPFDVLVLWGLLKELAEEVLLRELLARVMGRAGGGPHPVGHGEGPQAPAAGPGGPRRAPRGPGGFGPSVGRP